MNDLDNKRYKQYYSDDYIIIRSMLKEDADIFYNTYLSYGWHPNKVTYDNYYNEQENNKRKVFIALYNNEVAGICTLINKPTIGPFKDKDYYEIVDLSVFIKYRNKGIGNKLLDIVEEEAFKISNNICLAVGLHSGYGKAQRIYVKRGYNFDGSGVWYQGHQLDQYSKCFNDDDLVLYMSKSK